MKQLSIILAISTILGLLGLLLVTSPDITVSFIDSLKPICNALNIQTRAEAQSYILMFTLVSFVGCFITMILAFKGKQLRRRRERRVRQAREMRNLGSIVVNTKEDLKEIAKEEQKKEEEAAAAENVETPKKEKKSFVEAESFVKSKKSNINPNENFVKQLKEFEDIIKVCKYDLKMIKEFCRNFTGNKFKQIIEIKE